MHVAGIMKHAEESYGKIRINNNLPDTLPFADNQVIISKTEDELQCAESFK
jgi:hypothetical protein